MLIASCQKSENVSSLRLGSTSEIKATPGSDDEGFPDPNDPLPDPPPTDDPGGGTQLPSEFCSGNCPKALALIKLAGPIWEGVTSYENFHVYISEAQNVDVWVRVEARVNGTAYFTLWDPYIKIPAGQNNSETIITLPESVTICPQKNKISQRVSKTYTLHIMSISTTPGGPEMNNQFGLSPGTISVTLSTFCMKNDYFDNN